MKPESLLALRQAVDERLSTEQVETILNSIENKENSGNLLKRISDEGIIDDIIERLRGKPQAGDLPEHTTLRKKEQVNTLDPRKRYLSVRINAGSAFIDQLADFAEGIIFILSNNTVFSDICKKNV